jgi:hypothetical protein
MNLHSALHNSAKLWKRTAVKKDFSFPNCDESKGLMPRHIRLLFSIGFGDAADVFQVDAILFRARIVTKGESAQSAAQMLGGSIP